MRSGRSCVVSLVAALLLVSRAAAADAGSPGGVVVELRTDDPRVRIDRVTTDGVATTACRAPCLQPLDRGGVYVVTGEGVPATSRFTLPENGDQLVLKVRPGSRAAFIAGMTLVSVGVAAMTVGYLFSPGDRSADTPPDQPVSRLQTAALLTGLAGIGVALVGGYLIWRADTRVESSTGHSFTERPQQRHGRRPAVALTARGLEF